MQDQQNTDTNAIMTGSELMEKPLVVIASKALIGALSGYRELVILIR